jgi:hypothetical protein
MDERDRIWRKAEQLQLGRILRTDRACDVASPEHHPLVKKAKDVAAAGESWPPSSPPASSSSSRISSDPRPVVVCETAPGRHP